MKLFRKRKSSGVLLIVGSLLALIGWLLILLFRNAAVPEDYGINALDVIFVVPVLVKIIYYEGKQALFEAMTTVGWIQMTVGGGCFLLGIPAIPDVIQRIRNFKGYFGKGSAPTEQELHNMLESGEMTKQEYDEIHKYLNDR